MDQLAPSNVPVYETPAEGRSLWSRCADRRQPVVAIRNGERGFVVRYDLQHLDRELSEHALRGLRERVLSLRDAGLRIDSASQTDAVGGETGHVAGDLHVSTEAEARRLASHVSSFVFDPDNLV